MISPNLSSPLIPSPPSSAAATAAAAAAAAAASAKAISALLSSPASSTSSNEETNNKSVSPTPEVAPAVPTDMEKSSSESRPGAGFKMSNFSIAALINKDSEAELERRRKLVESMPVLGMLKEFTIIFAASRIFLFHIH